ncbi:hypothetical protein MAPG_10822, partial [Magnaporthiopsis poae ATCC 64411]
VVDSFTVTDKKASEVSGSVGGSGPVPAGGMMPVGGGRVVRLGPARTRAAGRIRRRPGSSLRTACMSSDRRARTTPRGRCFPTGRRSSPGRRGWGTRTTMKLKEMELVAVDAETSGALRPPRTPR